MKGSMYHSLLRRYCIRFMQADGLLDSMNTTDRKYDVFSLGSISAYSPSEVQPTLTLLLYPSLGSISAFSPSDIRRTLSILCSVTNLCFPSEIQRTLSYSALISPPYCVLPSTTKQHGSLSPLLPQCDTRKLLCPRDESRLSKEPTLQASWDNPCY